MRKKYKHPKYVEWLDIEDMHNASNAWLSELNFISDENYFFEDLIKSYTIQLIEKPHFEESKQFVEHLKKSKKRNKQLIEKIKTHNNELETLLDKIDQPKAESNYKNEHRELITQINEFMNDYNSLKKQIFGIIKSIMRKEKQRRLIERL